MSRRALDDLRKQVAFIAEVNPAAARRIAARIREASDALGEMATGRPGRVSGVYEKTLAPLPYIVAYELRPIGGREGVAIMCVVHTLRDWTADEWPG